MTYISSSFTRCSAEAAYLTPSVLARSNLTVSTNAHVTRILFEGKRAVGVEFARDKDGIRYQARARKEVVLRQVEGFSVDPILTAHWQCWSSPYTADTLELRCRTC
jgi:hypothetical protein